MLNDLATPRVSAKVATDVMTEVTPGVTADVKAEITAEVIRQSVILYVLVGDIDSSMIDFGTKIMCIGSRNHSFCDSVDVHLFPT